MGPSRNDAHVNQTQNLTPHMINGSMNLQPRLIIHNVEVK